MCGLQIAAGRAQASPLQYRLLYHSARMKTTLNIDDRLLAAAKALAASERSTLTRLVEEGLALRLRHRSPRKRRVRLPIFQGGSGLAPGIDARSHRALLDAADA